MRGRSRGSHSPSRPKTGRSGGRGRLSGGGRTLASRFRGGGANRSSYALAQFSLAAGIGGSPGIPEGIRQDVVTPFKSTKSLPQLGPGVSVVRASLKPQGREAVPTVADEAGTLVHLRLPILRVTLPQRHEV